MCKVQKVALPPLTLYLTLHTSHLTLYTPRSDRHDVPVAQRSYIFSFAGSFASPFIFVFAASHSALVNMR
jgi:hypothetical protein